MTIRAGVVPEDANLCANIWVRALAARDGSVDEQAMAEWVRKSLAIPSVRFSVATAPRLGFALVETVNDAPTVAYLHFVAVDPDGVGGGVGRALLADAIHHSREQGYAALELEVRDVNSRAIELYERAGFVAMGDPSPHPIAGYPMQRYGLTL